MIKILLIDDDLVDQMAIRRTIEQLPNASQFTIHVADSVTTAKAILTAETFHVIICDFNLGDGTAVDLLPFLKNKNWILLTGDDTNEIVNANSLDQCNLKLHKDFHLQYLNNLVQYLELQLAVSKKKKVASPTLQEKKSAINQLMHTFDNNKVIVKELIEIFMEQNPMDMEKLALAFSKNDFKKIQSIAHRIKSGFALLGFPELSQLAADIEKTPSSTNAITEKLKPLFNKLEIKTQEAYLELQNFE